MTSQYSLTVLRAQDVVLLAKPFRGKRTSLYCQVKIGDSNRRTQVIKNNFSPEWNESFSLSSSDASAIMNIQIKDSTLISDSCIACVDITLADLLAACIDGEAQIELQMPSQKGKNVMTRAGTLCLQLQVNNDMTDEIANVAGKFLREMSNLHPTLRELSSRIEMLMTTIDSVSQVHPYVAMTWQLVSALYKALSSPVEVDEPIVKLVQAMTDAFEFTEGIDSLRKKTRHLDNAVIALLKQTTECCIFVQQYTRTSFMFRTLDTARKAKVDEFLQSFTVLRNNIDNGINVSTALVSTRISETMDALFLRDRLDPRQTNAFNRPRCLSGTRVEILNQITTWALSDSVQNIFWLLGVAGSGKSTISATVTEYFTDISRRGSFLAFERGKSEPDSVIRTIAYDLAMFDSSIAKGVITAVTKDNNVAMSSAVNQFNKLLLEPLFAASAEMQGPVIVVLDALDECGASETRHFLMKLIIEQFMRLPKNLRFLITSRPETDITKALSSQPHILINQLDIGSESSQHDVLSYLNSEMHRVIDMPVPEDWSWEHNLKLLAAASGGLFIWAATAVRYVSSHMYNPLQALKELVENSRSLSLDELYATVLNSVGSSWADFNFKERFLDIFSLCLFSKEPLTVTTIDGLLGYSPDDSSRLILIAFSSVVDYSPDRPIRIFHASFSEYLLAQERSSDPWHIDAPLQKACLATRCFNIMEQSLRFNICDLESSHIHNDIVSDLSAHVDKRIPSHLLYACLYWAHHLQQAEYSSNLMKQFEDFLYRRLLYWLEVLSLRNRLASFRLILLDATAWTPTDCTDVLAFLRDARNLITSFYEGISQATPHIYVSLLPLSPTSSRVAAHYLKQTSSLVNVIRVGDERPPPLLKTITGHQSWVLSVAFSPDGTHIASGSADKTVRICDADSGEVVASPFEGHAGYVNTVTFSRDGTRLASGSVDKTILVWATNSGEIVGRPLEGHAESVTSVSFSRDGTRLASGSYDKTVLVWDINNGDVIAGPFEGHAGPIASVAFSPDGSRVVSGSDDTTVQVWLVNSDEAVAVSFEGHTDHVRSVVFSPDGTRIASGSDDMTIRIWEMSSNGLVSFSFEGHSSGVTSVAFSPNGTSIASGSDDNTIRVWDIASREVIAGPFEGHLSWVTSVSFSPDGTRVASGSFDRTVRVWDIVVSDPLERHAGENALVVRSSGGNLGLSFIPGSSNIVASAYNVGSTMVVPNAFRQKRSSSHVRQAIPNWTVDENGWLKKEDELLLWIPPFLRNVLFLPENTAVLNLPFHVKLDFTGFAHGKDWQMCFKPNRR